MTLLFAWLWLGRAVQAQEGLEPESTVIGAPAEVPMRDGVPVSWRRHKALSTAGLAIGYTSTVVTFAGGVASEVDPDTAGALFAAGSVGTTISTGLLLGGTAGNARFLDDRGIHVSQVGTWTGLGLGLGASGTAFWASGSVREDPESGFLAFVHLGLAGHALGVGVTQLHLNGDGLRTWQRGLGTPPDVVAKRFARARALGITGAVLGWGTLPFWALAGFTSGEEGGTASAVIGTFGIAGAWVGAPLMAGGVAWERRLLVEAGASPWRGGLLAGYVLGPLGGAAMGLEMVGAPVGTFIPGMLLHPLGLGLLTAQLFINERALHGGRMTAGGPRWTIAPYGGLHLAGLSASTRF